jgi:hypothetical protein
MEEAVEVKKEPMKTELDNPISIKGLEEVKTVDQ